MEIFETWALGTMQQSVRHSMKMSMHEGQDAELLGLACRFLSRPV